MYQARLCMGCNQSHCPLSKLLSRTDFVRLLYSRYGLRCKLKPSRPAAAEGVKVFFLIALAVIMKRLTNALVRIGSTMRVSSSAFNVERGPTTGNASLFSSGRRHCVAPCHALGTRLSRRQSVAYKRVRRNQCPEPPSYANNRALSKSTQPSKCKINALWASYTSPARNGCFSALCAVTLFSGLYVRSILARVTPASPGKASFTKSESSDLLLSGTSLCSSKTLYSGSAEASGQTLGPGFPSTETISRI
eukprot:3467099-Pleurochrysis_carterae.AAC.2